ncbi:hypothetical protein evm_015562, partial [Chilo suppressalis]
LDYRTLGVNSSRASELTHTIFFFNRIEPLINAQLGSVKPYLIPHHKGRKRMHLELKDTMARVGADIKQKLIESLKSTWSSMWKSQPPPHDAQLEKVSLS